MPKILITGATGFIGSRLCSRLVAEGIYTRATMRDETSRAQLPPGVLPSHIGQIGPETEWSEALEGIDTVIHLAARVHVLSDTADNMLAAYRYINVAGTEKLALAAARQGVRRLVFLSSVKVHGEATAVPYSESDCLYPQDSYGVSKCEAEEVLEKIAAETGLEVVIIRPPLVYGPGVRANFLSLLNAVQRGIPLPLARIDNCRSFVYLGNLVDAIATCMVSPKAAGQTYLVSDNEDVSTPDLINRIAHALDRPARLFPFPKALLCLAGAITGKSAAVNRLTCSLTVDSSKIRKELNWQPPFTMEQGLKETADWYKKEVRK